MLALALALCVTAPDQGAPLREAIARAVATGAKQVTLPPGTYRLNAIPDAGAHLLFDGVKDLAVDATGVEIVCTDPQASLVAFRNCARVTVKGMTVDCDPLQFTQGRITALEPDGKWLECRIDDGYRTDVDAFQTPRPLAVFEPGPEGRFKSGIADLFLGKVEAVSERVWRVHAIPEVIGRHRFPVELLAVGDRVALPRPGGPAWSCRGCVDMRFENVTLYQAGSIAFHEHAGGGGTVLRNCKVMRRPGTNRLLSTNADGGHFKNLHRGPDIQDCLFEGMHDDGINIHGMYSRVVAVEPDGTPLTCPGFVDWNTPGDTVAFYRQETGELLAERKIVSSERVDAKPYAEVAAKLVHTGPHFVYRTKVADPPPLAVGDVMASYDYNGRGFVIRHNVFRNHRYRAILLRTAHGVVEDNVIEGVTNDAIVLAPDVWGEGTWCDDIQVRRNTIRRAGMVPWCQAAIRVGVYGNLPYAGNRRIVIEDNVIDDFAGDGIRVENTDGVVVRNNRLSRIGERRVNKNVPVGVRMDKCGEVSLAGNTLADSPADVVAEARR